MSKIIGIDLGTSNSAASVMEGAKPVIIPSAEGATVAGKAFPSVVAMTKDNQLLVGEPARRQAVTNPEGTIMAAKRKMGTKEKFTLHGKEYTPEQISAFILQKIKKDAEAFLGQPVAKAVITVPAYFDDAQRQATKNAGEIAGLEVVRIINEPTAAAMAYGLDKISNEQRVLVFDLGGGTLDVTVMSISAEGGNQSTFEVLSTSGDTQLGGTDMDKAMVDYVAKEAQSQFGIDISKDAQAVNRVREAAEKAKIELSTVLETEINLPFITADQTGPKHLQMKLSRAKLESLVGDLVEKTFVPVKECLKDAKIDAKKVDEVILVGGMIRMPLVTRKVQEFFGKEPHKGLNPDEVVAVGAAVQGAVLGGEMKEMVLLDVTPLTLGIETLGAVSTALITRNTTVPTSKSEIFSTASDNQTSVEINVLQGERPMAADNKSLGRFILDGIPPAPRGVPQVEVTFDLDANGILHVKAKDKATSKEQSIKITGSTGLTQEEIERMTKEAEEHAKEDESKKEEIEIRNRADSLVYQAEKSLKDAGDKVPADVKTEVEGKIKALKEIESSAPIDEVKTKTDELSQVLSKIGESMYSQKGAEGTKDTKGTDGPTEETKGEEPKKEDTGDVQEGEVVKE